MSECESVRGEWGEICPDCGRRLPEALPWDHGRPCAKTAPERGMGWNGGPPQANPSSRWTTASRVKPKVEDRIYKVSPEARERMRAGQARRWATARGEVST